MLKFQITFYPINTSRTKEIFKIHLQLDLNQEKKIEREILETESNKKMKKKRIQISVAEWENDNVCIKNTAQGKLFQIVFCRTLTSLRSLKKCGCPFFWVVIRSCQRQSTFGMLFLKSNEN